MSYIQTDMTQREVELAARVRILEDALRHAHYPGDTDSMACSDCATIQQEIDMKEIDMMKTRKG